MDDVNDAETPSYQSRQWGALATDPWMEIASLAAGLPCHRAALRAWLADGGSAEVFETLCDPSTVGQ